MASEEMPRQPYVLLFEDVVPGAIPLTILVDDSGAVPLFDSDEKAEGFLASTDFSTEFEAVEVSGAGLARALESVEREVNYVAINPPPAGEGPMRVRMGGLRELIDALRQNPEDDLFGLGGLS
jgi:hypothetical protein